MRSSPFISKPDSVSVIMRHVLLALLPGIALYVWYFGPAILISLALASVTALVCEALMLHLRQRPVKLFLQDNSALVTSWLLALSIPPLAPWWLIVVGTACAIIVAKHLYGGLGSNPFNPAMVGYAVLIVSFPVPMTQWLAPQPLLTETLSFGQQLIYYFTGTLPDHLALDAITMSTPLDTLKTYLHSGDTVSQIMQQPIFGQLGGVGTEMVALGFLLGGIYLLIRRIITWQIPLVFLLTLFMVSGIFYAVDSASYASPWFHCVSGAAVLAAFFILTDPVSGPTTWKGKIIFAAGAALLTYLIRIVGAYPEGVAFAVLLMNMCVPLIDKYTQPAVFGRKKGQERAS